MTKKMNKSEMLLLALGGAFMSFQASAGEGSNPTLDKAQEFLSNATYEVSADVTAYAHDPESVNADDDRAHLGLKATMSSQTALSDSLELAVDLRLALSTQHAQYTGMFREPGSESNEARILGFDQVYLTHLADDYEVSVGKKNIQTGNAEIYSPTNRFGLADGSDPANTDEFGVWHVGASYFIEDDVLTMRIAPFHENALSPNQHSRWLGSSGDSDFVNLEIANANTANITNLQFGNAPKNWGYGLEYTGVREGFDFFALAHHGPSIYPVLKQDPSNTASFIKEFPLASSLGGGVSKVIDAWKLYGEGILQVTDSDKDDDFLRYSAGFSYRETEFANKIGLDEIKPIVEYSGDATLDDQSATDYVQSSETARPFQNALSTRLEIQQNDKWAYALGTNVSMDENDYTVNVGAEYRPNDNMKVQLSASLFEGKSDTYYGRWDDNDNIRLAFKYSF